MPNPQHKSVDNPHQDSQNHQPKETKQGDWDGILIIGVHVTGIIDKQDDLANDEDGQKTHIQVVSQGFLWGSVAADVDQIDHVYHH